VDNARGTYVGPAQPTNALPELQGKGKECANPMATDEDGESSESPLSQSLF